MKLRYYDPVKGAPASYTGNISEWEWQHKGTGIATPQVNTYAFNYDKLSRLKNTTRYVGSTLNNAFTERDITYDRNGNFLTLKRYGANNALVDDISIPATNYRGNQIISATNKGTSYTYAYDKNGNMTTDGLNVLNLEYNYLNLTAEVSDLSDNTLAQYRWLADGSKAGVRNSATGSSGLEYLGSLVYKRDNTGLKLESAGFGGGRIEVSQGSGGNVYNPNYYLTDHLSSTRVVFRQNGTTNLSIIERNDYQPFGSRHDNPLLASSTTNRHRFSGKENQAIGNLPYQDFGARFFGGKLPISTQADPLGHERPWESPFTYAANNPVNLIDWMGLSPQKPDTNDTRISLSVKTSWGPQLGIRASVGALSIGGVARYKNLEGRMTFSATHNQESGWSAKAEPQGREIEYIYGGGIDSPLLPIASYEKEKSRTPGHHEVFTETIETKQEGLVETVEKNTSDGGDDVKTKQENTVINVGLELNLGLFGFGVEIRLESVGEEKRVN